MIVAATSDDGWLIYRHRSVWSFVGVSISWVCCERTSSVVSLVRNQLDFFSDEVISGFADTTVSVPVIVGMLRTKNTVSTNSYITYFAPAADLIPILMKAANWRDEDITSLSGCIVDLIHTASLAGTIDQVVAKSTDTCLFFLGVNFIFFTRDVHTLTISSGISNTAAAIIIFREICLIDGTSLAHILDGDESRKAFTNSIDDMLIDTARVYSNALHENGVILISLSTFTTVSIDGDVS